MDSRHGKMRMDVQGDRLSRLPDDLIHKILSFIGTKHAIQTSVLSSRWRYIWTSMPSLNFSMGDFLKLSDISKSATHVLSNRNNQIQMSSVKLDNAEVSQLFLNRILEYAVSHNVQQVDITCFPIRKIEFPLSLFTSQSLKHLTLRSCMYEHFIIMTPPTWELQALTTLNLHCVTLNDDSTNKCVGLFSNCANLKNLTLKSCKLNGFNGSNIYHPGLSNLTLEHGFHGVIVDTPQLKNLTIRYCRGMHRISAPNLSSLQYKDYYYRSRLSADFLHLETVDICITCPSLVKKSSDKTSSSEDESSSSSSEDEPSSSSSEDEPSSSSEDEPSSSSSGNVSSSEDEPSSSSSSENESSSSEGVSSSEDESSPEDESDAHKIVGLLQQLHSVKFLTLNSEIITLLSSSVELASHQPSPFVNIKSLKIYPANVPLKEFSRSKKPDINMSTEVKNYLLGSSPDATLTVISHEEIRAVKNVASAHCLMRELQEELDQLKENSKMNTTDMAQPYTQMKWHFGERMAHIESYWEDLNHQLEKGYKNAGRIVSMLRVIEGVLAKLPISHRAKLQTRFSGLCAEADTVTDNMVDHWKIQCDKKPRLKCLL